LVLKILYVEDEPRALEYVQKGLTERGFTVEVAADAEHGLELALGGSFDLLILDVMLPKMDGFQMLRELRSHGIETPTLFLSARVEVHDRITGLNHGADDYLAKPFAFEELVARIRAIARRAKSDPADAHLQVGDLVVDLDRLSASRTERPLKLTPKEFTLLAYLARNAGQVVSRAMIAQKVWGYEYEHYSNVIDVHLSHLRRKLDHPAERRLLHTVTGVGYVLEDRGANEGSAATDASRD
jgi:two-component system copper resistance phosphate regulon response regulator CusR